MYGSSAATEFAETLQHGYLLTENATDVPKECQFYLLIAMRDEQTELAFFVGTEQPHC